MSFARQIKLSICEPGIKSTYLRLCSSVANRNAAKPMSENDCVNPDFINRNPRNLDRLSYERKQLGWKYENPRRNYWYKLAFNDKDGFKAQVVHCSGDVVLKASSKEFAISRHLFSTKDTTAAVTVARVLAQRCKQCGLHAMVLDPAVEETVDDDPRQTAFLKEFTKNGISLEEKLRIVPSYSPGIAYDDPEALEDLHERQNKVFNLGHEHRMAQKLKTKNHRGHWVYSKWPLPPQNFDPVKDAY